MKKKILLFVLIAVLAFTFTACKSDEAVVSDELNQDLLKLLPNEGFQWAYIGPAEYYHEMRLETITADAAQAIYKVTGEVEDVSNGEGNKNYTIELYYEIGPDSIVQKKTAETMLDSEYDTLTLIKTPLEVNNKWTESVTDQNGKKQTIEGSIIEISETDEGNIYKVVYKNSKTGYVESRKILEGIGVIAFTKAVEIDGEQYQYGYGLYGKSSGYIAKENTTSDVATDDTTDSTETDTTDATTDGEDDTDATTDDSTDDSTTDATEEDSTTAEPEEKEDTVNEEIEVKAAITTFNDAWIDYVNNGNQDYFNYVVKNGQAYNSGKNFNRDGLTEEFIVMNVGQVIVNGSTATAKVYEEIKKTKGDDVSIAKYNWLYDLVKRDGKWLINGYRKQ